MYSGATCTLRCCKTKIYHTDARFCKTGSHSGMNGCGWPMLYTRRQDQKVVLSDKKSNVNEVSTICTSLWNLYLVCTTPHKEQGMSFICLRIGLFHTISVQQSLKICTIEHVCRDIKTSMQVNCNIDIFSMYYVFLGTDVSCTTVATLQILISPFSWLCG